MMKRRILALAMSICMVLTLLPSTAFATGVTDGLNRGSISSDTSPVYSHHEHDHECSYREAVPETPCGHLQEDGTYHCDPGLLATPSEATEDYVCPHKMNGGEAACGYREGEPEQPCNFDPEDCEICNLKDKGEVQGQCFCDYPQQLEQLLAGEEASLYHAPDCPLFDEDYQIPTWNNLPPYATGDVVRRQTRGITSASYIAFGDSIPLGYKLADTKDGFVARLGAKDGITVDNRAVSGETAAGMKDLITGSTLDTALASAKYVTITSGGNDMMAVLYEAIAEAYNNPSSGSTPPAVTITAAEVPDILNGTKYPDKRMAVLLAVASVIDAGYGAYTDDFQAVFTDVVDNIKASVDYIHGQNPDAKIYVTNQYNPYKDVVITNPLFPNDLDFGSFMEDGLAEFNPMLTQASTGADEVINIYEAFETSGTRPVNSTTDGSDFDFHPNAVGHGLYFNELDTLIVGAPLVFDGGDGTQGAPYEIATAGQLAKLATLVNDSATSAQYGGAYYKLTADIDLSGVSNWTPIGYPATFYGNFDGGGFVVSNLTIDCDANYQGLFGFVDGGEIKNVGLENANIKGRDFVGGLAGTAQGRSAISNCYVTGSVRGGEKTGGLVGYALGNTYAVTIENCYVTGDVTSTSYCVGGLVGQAWGVNNGTVTIKNSAALNPSVGGIGFVGRVVGYNNGGTLTNNHAFEGMTGGGTDKTSTGLDGLDATMKNIATASWWTTLGFTAPTWTTADGALPGFSGNTVDMPAHLKVFDGGMGTQGAPYEIATAGQLAKLATLVNAGNGSYNAAYYELTADIDLSGYQSGTGWTPIGTFNEPFQGHFDGKDFNVKNLKIDNGSIDEQGLFGTIINATIQNLGVESADIKGQLYVGALVGYARNSTISSCYATGKVDGSEYVGGLLGVTEANHSAVNVKNCYATSKVDGDSNVGGLVGDVTGYLATATVENSYATGSVTGTGNRVGGLVGNASGAVIMEHCYAAGTVACESGSAGGLVGNVQETTSGIVKVANSAALNPSVHGVSYVGNTSYVGRVVGLKQGGFTLTNNHAFDGMTLTDYSTQQTPKPSATGKDGANATVDNYVNASWWVGTLGFPSPPWTTADGQLPGLNGKTVAIPDHLKPQYYALTVIGGTGSGNYKASVVVPITTDEPESGKVFDKWISSGGGGLADEGSPTTTYTMPASAATVTATYKAAPAASYTITFDANGGSVAPASAATGADGRLQILPTPTRSNYRFDGWFTAANGGVQVTTSTVFSSNASIFAHWTYTGGNYSDDSSDDNRTTFEKTLDTTVSNIGNAKPGDRLTLDMTGNPALPGKVLGALAGKDVTLTLTIDGGVSWVIRGTDLPKGSYGSLNLGVNTKANTIPVTVINNVTGEANVMQLALAHNGAFGFKLTLVLETGKENSGLWANLYYYNPTTKALDYRVSSLIQANGKANLPFDHASDYAVVIDKRNLGAPVFTDTTNHWAKDSIDFVAARGLLTGTSATTFFPDTGITRGMFVTSLGRLAGIDSTKYESTKFTDVPATAYYAPYAVWAAEKGITSGTTETTFSPDKTITRQELALLMANYAKTMNYTLPKTREAISFADSANIASWAKDAVAAMQTAGVINGKDGNKFDPTGTATRAEVSAVLHRYVELVIDPATAQGLDINDSGSAMMYEGGKLVKSAIHTTNGSADDQQVPKN